MSAAAPPRLHAGHPPKLEAGQPPEVRHFDPILRPDLAGLYGKRAARLRKLSEGHDLAEYLRLAAAVTEAQAALTVEPAPQTAPADPLRVALEGGWPSRLDAMLELLRPRIPAPAAPHLEALAALPEAERRKAAAALVEGRFDLVEAASAPFLWAALSLEVAEAARAAPLPSGAREESADCPICGTAPTASLILTGDRQGLRYLHCPLCECEWHMTRAKCSNCGDAGNLDYLSFETPEAAVRAESCGACGGYLKTISEERDPEVETVADDLASLPLDDAAAAEGFGRTGFNPFALPGAG